MREYVAGNRIEAGSAAYIRSDGKVYNSNLRWKFPETPFVEYEKSDEEWAIPLKFGRWVPVRPFYPLGFAL